MIPNVTDRDLQTDGVTAAAVFGISLKDSAHIMTILRDTLYSDKVMAVLREYSANAWDAHRQVGKHEVPIHVTMPTQMEPTLSIRDHGPGLSHDDVFNVFTQYGASTKRGDDVTVGMLGIGSKSGFAYSDSFTVTSWHHDKVPMAGNTVMLVAMKRVYVAVLDKTDKGLINLLHEEPCDVDESGIQIQLAIKQSDINEFTRKAITLYRHFSPRPKINLDLPPEHKGMILKNGYIREGDGWTAVMGCVPYRVNTQQLDDGTPLPAYMHQLAGVLFFDIGEVQVNASREELKYSSSTKKTIREKIYALVDEYVVYVLKEISDNGKTPWARRLMARALKLFLLPVVDASKELGHQSVTVRDTPVSFRLSVVQNRKKKMETAEHLQVGEDTRIVIRDDSRGIQGFGFGHNDYVLIKKPVASWDSTERQLADFLAHKNLTGIPIVKSSTLPWHSKGGYRYSGSSVTPRASIKMFELTDPNACGGRALSACWKAVENRAPTPDDIFVVLERFESVQTHGFYHMVMRDQEMLEQFKMKMPKIYGYRSTEKAPIDIKKVVGVEYTAWRTKMIADLAVQKADLLTTWVNSNALENVVSDTVWTLTQAFGVDHPITTFVNDHVEAQKTVKRIEKSKEAFVISAIKTLWRETGQQKETTKTKLLRERYPLLDHYGIENLWDKEERRDKEWVKYVKLIDSITTYPRTDK